MIIIIYLVIGLITAKVCKHYKLNEGYMAVPLAFCFFVWPLILLPCIAWIVEQILKKI